MTSAAVSPSLHSRPSLSGPSTRQRNVGLSRMASGAQAKFRQVSHQLTAHQRGRVLGACDRDEAERHDVEPPFAVLQRIARRDQSEGAEPSPPLEFATRGPKSFEWR